MNETDSYINLVCSCCFNGDARGIERGGRVAKFVRGIIRPYLIRGHFYFAAIIARRRYNVVINNGDKGLLLRRFKQYFSRTMSRNYCCPFPTADYASSFNAELRIRSRRE